MSGFENADSEAKKNFLVIPNKGNLFFLNATNKYYGLFSHLEFCIKNAEWEKKQQQTKAERFNFPTGNKSAREESLQTT